MHSYQSLPYRRTLLMLAGMAILLGACGQPRSREVSNPPAAPPALPPGSPTPFIYITPTPLNGLPGGATIQAETDAAATRDALDTPVPTWPPGTPHIPDTRPPETPGDTSYLTRHVGAGILFSEDVAPDLPSALGEIHNRWAVELPSQVIWVYAGAKPGATNDQGIVIVRIYDRTTGHIAEPVIYPTPQRAGSVKIVDGTGMQLTLQASNGTLFYFDVTTQHWITIPVADRRDR